MDREEAEIIFFERDLKPLLEKSLLELELYYEQNKECIRDRMLRSLQLALIEVRKKDFLPGFLVYTLLRTELMEGNGRYLIRVYDKDWYFGKQSDLLWYRVDWGYQFFYQFWEAAKKESRKYIGKVSDAYVKNLVLHLLPEYHRKITAAFSQEKTLLFGLAEWQEIPPEMELYFGEYMGKVQRIGKED